MAAIIVLAIVGVVISALRGERAGKKTQAAPSAPRRAAPPNRGSSYEPGPLVFRRGAARIVTCKASSRLGSYYFVGMDRAPAEKLNAEAVKYAKRELAALLAEQALAAGGIRFTQVGDELRAELLVVTKEAGCERE